VHSDLEESLKGTSGRQENQEKEKQQTTGW
jgi:hypothetical protein